MKAKLQERLRQAPLSEIEREAADRIDELEELLRLMDSRLSPREAPDGQPPLAAATSDAAPRSSRVRLRTSLSPKVHFSPARSSSR